MEEKQSQIGNNKETQRWGTARKYFPPWARGTVEEVVLPEPRDQEHLVEAEAMDETQPCQRCHPRQEWEETSLSLLAAHADQSPFQASHWPNSATDLGAWEMQTIAISPHHPHPTQSREMEGEEMDLRARVSKTVTEAGAVHPYLITWENVHATKSNEKIGI